ncbi:MAG: transposase [Methylococcales bacterium]|nr:transposase [Methylococcales bacterium]
MKSKRYTTEQKIRILRDAERAGKSIVDVCREKGISEQTFHRWKRQFGMMPLDQAKRLKELEKENARLKRLLAEEILGKELLKEALGKSCEPRPQAPDRRYLCEPGLMQRTCRLSSCWTAPQHLPIRSETTQCMVVSFEDSS